MNKGFKKIAKKILDSISIFITFMYITVFLCFSPTLFSLKIISNKIKIIGPDQEVMYLLNQKFLSLLKFDIGITYDNKALSKIVFPYFIKSFELLILGIFLGLILGILKGILDSKKKETHGGIKIISSVIPLSLPDILLIAILQYTAIWLSKHGIKVLKVGGTGTINHIILPVIALALPCACYIARITAVSIEECYKNQYIKTALGKGCSSQRILWNHVMRNVIGIVFEGLSSITAMIICNLVIVEYLFSYSGLTKLLIQTQENFDRSSTVSIIILIGIVYFVLDIMLHFLRLLIYRSQTEEII